MDGLNMNFHLVIYCREGKYKDNFIHTDFNAKNEEQALLFTKAITELKTFNNEPIELGSYVLRKRYFLFFYKTISTKQTYMEKK